MQAKLDEKRVKSSRGIESKNLNAKDYCKDCKDRLENLANDTNKDAP